MSRGITEIGRNRWRVRVRWTDPRTGRAKEVSRRVEGTKRDALAFQTQLRRELREDASEGRVRLGDFAERWASIHGEVLRRSTRERYVLSLAYIDEGLGDFYVDALLPSDVHAWQAALARRMAPTTVNGHQRVLKQVLDAAMADGLVRTNAASAVPPLREGRTRGRRARALDAEGFRAFLAAVERLSWPVVMPGQKRPPGLGKRPETAISEDLARALLVLAWTGARRGEVFALRFRDYRDGELWLERAVWRGEEAASKTDDPRAVVVAEPLRRVLIAQRQWLIRVQHPVLQAAEDLRDLVFPAYPHQAEAGLTRRKEKDEAAELSWYRSGSSVDAPLHRAVTEAKAPDISVHSLRRTVEDLGRKAGIDVLVRRATSGWRSERAQGIYATVDRQEREAAAKVFERYVLGGGEG